MLQGMKRRSLAMLLKSTCATCEMVSRYFKVDLD